AVCGRTPERLDAARATLEPYGRRVLTVQADVRDHESVARMFEYLESELGPVTTLVNNAAGNFYSASEDLSPGGFKAVIDIVLHGTFNCSHTFGNRAIANKRPGVILNIVTSYTETGSAFVLPSACAKAGDYALTTTLAYEWAEYGFRVNAIAPGPFPTPGAWKRLVPNQEFEDQYRLRQPFKRFGEPHELAAAATFLISDAASYINGECLHVDGGERLSGGQLNFLTQLLPRDSLKGLFRKMRAARSE
ncbi:MAG: SDR family oxidoreductase, partial [Bdellovibrionales bacterium]|nr:SDR family oxidoreductase [Bdellovibrionales bacterium]